MDIINYRCKTLKNLKAWQRNSNSQKPKKIEEN